MDVQVSPAARAQSYRKVLIAPVRVELDRDFPGTRSALPGQLPRLRPEAAREIARDMGESFEMALARAFHARGFEVVSAPGPDVLALSPALRELRVNAPEGSGPASSRVYVREAGQATMEVEGRDAAGTRVVYANEKRTAGRTSELDRASDVSNRFWFDAMFRRWAEEVAAAVAHPR